MGVYLAVDAGGTRTECVLAEGERTLARVVGPSVLGVARDRADATAVLHRQLHELSSKAGIPLYLVQRTCAGIAGLVADGVRSWAEESLRELLPGELVLTGIEDIALEAAFGEGPGVLVLAGSGSHIVGRCSNRSRYTAGGWGPMLGDAGSAHWIGLEGLRAGLRALDRGIHSPLLREMQELWKATNLRALIAAANGQSRPDFTLLSGAVVRCAAGRDKLAATVLQRAGEELAAQLAAVLGRMRAAACAAADQRRVAFTGSVLREVEPVYQAMVASLQRSHPEVTVDKAATEPVEGALARARRR